MILKVLLEQLLKLPELRFSKHEEKTNYIMVNLLREDQELREKYESETQTKRGKILFYIKVVMLSKSKLKTVEETFNG